MYAVISIKILVVQKIWPVLETIYAPWILPYDQGIVQEKCSQWIQQMNFNCESLLLPWISSDATLASSIVQDFVGSVVFLVDMLPGTLGYFI